MEEKTMTANQIYTLINDIQKEALGERALTVKDTGTLVSLGELTLSSQSDTEKFYSCLVDRIGRSYVKYRRYIADGKDSIMRSPLDFGIILQKIQTHKLGTAIANPSWYNPSTYDNAVAKDTTDIQQSLFSKMGTWEIAPHTVLDYQLKTAFTSAEAMGAFVNMIFNDMYNALEFEIEQCIKLTRSTLIAQCFKGNNANIRRNLLAEYNANHTALTIAEALESPEFIKFANREINKVAKRFKNMTSLFNSAGADRFTPESEMAIEILTDYASASASYMESDTYHNELVKLPLYKEIDSWLSSGTGFEFADVSSINITDEADITCEKSGIIAVIRDKDACGIMVDRVRTKSLYSPASERTTYWHKADWGAFVDNSENCVVFYLEESTDDSQE